MFEGQRIAYTEFGGGPAAITAGGSRGRTASSAPAAGRPLILIHGLFLSQRMHTPLAEDLAARGNRVITIDLLGHGESDRPRDMWRYSMSIFGEQVVGLMDHLELDQAVVLGTSLGANTALELAATLRVAAGIGSAPEDLPRLDEGIRDAWLGEAPQNLAESVAQLDGARNVHQARDAAREHDDAGQGGAAHRLRRSGAAGQRGHHRHRGHRLSRAAGRQHRRRDREHDADGERPPRHVRGVDHVTGGLLQRRHVGEPGGEAQHCAEGTTAQEPVVHDHEPADADHRAPG